MKQTWTAGVLRCAAVALALLALLSPPPASAQAVSGTIFGTVYDSSGAALPGPSVTLTNTATGLTRTVLSDPKGEYTAPLLPTGTYSVTAEMGGFKKTSMSNVHVGVDQKVRTDFKLELGQMTEALLNRATDDRPPTTDSAIVGDLSSVVRGLDASQRAADLTSQILAYFGKGRSFTRPVSVSEIICEMSVLIHSSLPPGVSQETDSPG